MILPIALKILLILSLASILYQDIKERAVWWFLFPIFFIISGFLHFKESIFSLFFLNISFNFIAVVIIFFCSFLYSRFKMKVNFLQDAIGLGDLLFFFGLSLAFPTGSFAVILVFSLIFSLALHVALSGKQQIKTVPLAGYSSLFLICIYISHWTGLYKNLYLIG